MVAARLSQTKMAAQLGADKRYVGMSDLKSPTDGTSVYGVTPNKSDIYKGNRKLASDDAYRSVYVENEGSSSGITVLRPDNGGMANAQNIHAKIGLPD